MNRSDLRKLIWLNNCRYNPFSRYPPMTYKTMKRLEYLEKHIDDGEFPVTLFLIEKALSQQK